jgi:3-dehydroquinate dehydratase/shikimate dehydrogenase
MSPKVPLVTLAMGEVGFPTRVLSTALGSIFTYAAPAHAQGTASGQVNARQLRSLYRIDKFSKAAKIYAVIADPVRHSVSPQVHNRAFQSRRMDAVHVPLLVSPTQLRDFFAFAEEMPLSGFSVTLPHKRRIMRYLDYIDPIARRIGAVNTVRRKGGKWRGSNTDAPAVSGPLGKLMNLQKATALIVGNGGAARAAACALVDAGTKVAITGRNADRVRALARLVGGEAVSGDQVKTRYYDVVINATPIGMWPNVSDCYFPGEIPGDVVFDMVYNPLETMLIRHAKQQSKQVVPGVRMFIEQALLQFEIWTGESAPRAAMETAAMDALTTRYSEQRL